MNTIFNILLLLSFIYNYSTKYEDEEHKVYATAKVYVESYDRCVIVTDFAYPKEISCIFYKKYRGDVIPWVRDYDVEDYTISRLSDRWLISFYDPHIFQYFEKDGDICGSRRVGAHRRIYVDNIKIRYFDTTATDLDRLFGYYYYIDYPTCHNALLQPPRIIIK